MRKTKTVVARKTQLVDVICDGCGCSCRSQLDRNEFETAEITGVFNEGDPAGDRFHIELCSACFFDLLEWFLLDKKGVLEYYNIVDQDQSADMDELRLYFAHRRSGTLPVQLAQEEE